MADYILIKGMEMPKSCDNCWALDDYGDYPRCRITEEQRGYNFPIRDKRMDKCPLIEVPEDVAPVVHGHWIIRDRKRYLISCSNCNWINVHGKFDYCPSCGAKMDLLN